MNAQNSRANGFTLIEVLVSMGIFGFTFLALAAGATTIMRANQTSHLNTTATTLAQDKLEELKAVNPANITSGGPVIDTISGVTYTRTWAVTTNSPVVGVKQIDVTVSWSDYINHSLTISSGVMG